ncbi:hypothetical protein L3X38_041260 [Prunus dulcis]|uniref:Uncharacterized protein n=1 Tax=Prunus dulcis TaxID=3755 RepID=A0AAD4UUC0_PRUDU|nr:hypothetical protein L3X38_041260 [Prunus dulcis]
MLEVEDCKVLFLTMKLVKFQACWKERRWDCTVEAIAGQILTRGIRFQVNHKVSCVREQREKGNSPPLSPLEGKSNWVTHPSLQVMPSKSNNYQNSNLK